MVFLEVESRRFTAIGDYDVVEMIMRAAGDDLPKPIEISESTFKAIREGWPDEWPSQSTTTLAGYQHLDAGHAASYGLKPRAYVALMFEERDDGTDSPVQHRFTIFADSSVVDGIDDEDWALPRGTGWGVRRVGWPVDWA